MKSHALLDEIAHRLRQTPKTWLVTGAAGFIGSHLVEELLKLQQRVIGLDNFSTGKRENLSNAEHSVGGLWSNFNLIQGDLRDPETCKQAVQGVDIILQQAALGSVPRSIKSPLLTNENNVTGFLNLLTAAKDAGVKRFVYASSSSVYGDNTDLPKREDRTGMPLSPYAITKVANELYSKVFGDLFGIETIGLRYFNVFGPRQLLGGPYAAVIPNWIQALLNQQPVEIFGDGTVSRDFCYVKNTVQMNLLAATTENLSAFNRVFNTACNRRTSLTELYRILRTCAVSIRPDLVTSDPLYRLPRLGDIQHSQADISDAGNLLGYEPLYDVAEGLALTTRWYMENKTASLSEADMFLLSTIDGNGSSGIKSNLGIS